MTCEDLLELFSLYLDGELPPEGCSQIERHAAECERCTEFLNSAKRTVTLCRDLKAGEKPRPLTSEARERLLELYERRSSRAPR
jgi:anti-sigma factor RsiW